MALAPAVLSKRPRRSTSKFGPAAVVLALAVALTSFLIFAGYTPLAPTENVVFGLFIANVFCILLLLCLVVA